MSKGKVLRHLRHTIGWYRQIAALQQSAGLPENEIARNRLQRASLAAVRYAFQFARAAAVLIDAQPRSDSTSAPKADSTDEAARLDRAAARIAARVAALQSRIAGIDTQLARAPARERATLVAQRQETVAALSLSQEIQKTIVELQQFAANTAARASGATASLTAQIDAMQRALPESRATETKPPADTTAARTVTAATASSVGTQRSGGLVALVSQWLALRSVRVQLDHMLTQTDGLSTELDTLRFAVSRQARTLVRAGVADTGSVSTDELQAAQHRLEAAAACFKQLSTLLVPLGEEDITVDDAHASLSEWHDVFDARSDAIARSLLVRVFALVASIAIVLIVSELWRRATFRYLHDMRRRRQFLILRRVVVTMALIIIVVLGFVSEVGSLATYVGFLTAGLAVALQNVILAVVAYFFLIGRYGVRVGDRITLAGVTGRVVDIGLIRIYLMELAGPELQPTGRIVVLSNAVLFQPAALFKQIPGASYTWHSITLSLPPTSDVAAVQARLKKAADGVYATYRAGIDAQHAAVQRMVDFDTAQPEPQVDVRFTERALEFMVRYPVLPDQAAANDQAMTRALHDAAGTDHVDQTAAVAT